MSDFSHSSKYRLSMDGDRVTVQIGLDGLKIFDSNSNRTLRSLELGHISRRDRSPLNFCCNSARAFPRLNPLAFRWQCRGTTLVLFVKTPNEIEERQITLTVRLKSEHSPSRLRCLGRVNMRSGPVTSTMLCPEPKLRMHACHATEPMLPCVYRPACPHTPAGTTSLPPLPPSLLHAGR